MTLAKAFVESGYFADVKSVAQAVVKIVAGQEVGLGPMASLMGIHMVQGKPTWAANLMATQIRRSGRYDYRVKELTDTACELEFFEGKRLLGSSRFTIDDARKAELGGKPIWKSYPRNMLFARAMSNGCRWYCADVFGGVTAYTPEELNAQGAAERVDTATSEIVTFPTHEPPADDLPSEAEIDAVDVVDVSDAQEQAQPDASESHRVDLRAAIYELADSRPDGKGRQALKNWWGQRYPDTPETCGVETLEAAYHELSAAKKNGKR
jgi:hypothetical protein